MDVAAFDKLVVKVRRRRENAEPRELVVRPHWPKRQPN
jgi:hypothetical protein